MELRKLRWFKLEYWKHNAESLNKKRHIRHIISQFWKMGWSLYWHLRTRPKGIVGTFLGKVREFSWNFDLIKYVFSFYDNSQIPTFLLHLSVYLFSLSSRFLSLRYAVSLKLANRSRENMNNKQRAFQASNVAFASTFVTLREWSSSGLPLPVFPFSLCLLMGHMTHLLQHCPLKGKTALNMLLRATVCLLCF